MKRFALTFDDGPGPSTPALLDVLAAARVHATFFLLGVNVEKWPDVARRVVAEGHVAGNHSYSHLKPAQWRDFRDDVVRGEATVRALGASDVPFRLPYGVQIVDGGLDPRVPVIASLGVCHQHWTSDFDDWTLRPSDGPALAARMIRHIEEWPFDAVLDLHDSGRPGSEFGMERAATVEGVRLLLEEAARRGWRTFSVGRR